jgi:hypothetical protein
MACCLFAAWLFGLAIRGLRRIHLLPQAKTPVVPTPRVAGPSMESTEPREPALV